MNCLIIDDNKMDRLALRQLVSEIDFLTLIADCDSAFEAIKILNKEKVDLLLLDVEMPKMSGIDFLKNSTTRPLVILITAKPNYAVEAFEYNVVDFIVKPVQEDRFIKAVHRAKEIHATTSQTVEMNKEFFFIRAKSVYSKLMIADILFIQAIGDYVTIHTPNKNYTIHYTLSAIEKELPGSKFMRIHRSYVAAIDKIETIEEGTVYINQTAVPVSDTQRSELLRRINLL